MHQRHTWNPASRQGSIWLQKPIIPSSHDHPVRRTPTDSEDVYINTFFCCRRPSMDVSRLLSLSRRKVEVSYCHTVIILDNQISQSLTSPTIPEVKPKSRPCSCYQMLPRCIYNHSLAQSPKRGRRARVLATPGPTDGGSAPIPRPVPNQFPKPVPNACPAPNSVPKDVALPPAKEAAKPLPDDSGEKEKLKYQGAQQCPI